jgi:hypothetical protein
MVPCSSRYRQENCPHHNTKVPNGTSIQNRVDRSSCRVRNDISLGMNATKRKLQQTGPAAKGSRSRVPTQRTPDLGGLILLSRAPSNTNTSLVDLVSCHCFHSSVPSSSNGPEAGSRCHPLRRKTMFRTRRARWQAHSHPPPPYH